MHSVGTVPTDKMNPIGIVPMDKMHPIGTLIFSFCQAQLRLQLQLQFEADFALFSFYPPPTHHPPIRTSSDFNSNFSLYNFQARAMLGSSLAS